MADAGTHAGMHLSILAATQQAQWGERIADNVARYAPPAWTVHKWAAPVRIPPVVDDPDDYLPPQLPQAELLLALGETAGFYQLVPDIVRLCGARAVIAPIDRNESLPPGLAGQLARWLDGLGVRAVFPRPFCTLTPTHYNRAPVQRAYDDPLVRAFAAHFGQPRFRLTVDAGRRLAAVEVVRDSACGCARHVAAGLVGRGVAEAEYEAGMLHHHYPCLASMNQDADYQDTLMHVSGHLLRDAVKDELRPHLEPTPYFQPQGRVDSEAESHSEPEE